MRWPPTRRPAGALTALPFLILFAAVVQLARGGETFRALVRRAHRGDARAVGLLVRQLLPVVQARVRHFFAARSGRPLGASDADDLVQEIWIALLDDKARLLQGYDPERGATPQGYVGMLVQRELWNRLQRENAQKRGGKQRHVSLDDVVHPPSGDDDPESTALSRALLASLSEHLQRELPDKGCDVLRLLYDEHLSAADAADRLGVRTQVVYNWQHRIRTEARRFLAVVDSPSS